MPATLAVRTQRFIAKATTVHAGKYDYTRTNYIDADTKITIGCPTHGDFQQIPSSHARGHGCLDCGRASQTAKMQGRPGHATKQPLERFLAKAAKAHGDTYDYSQVVYERFDKPVLIICSMHGSFQQRPVDHARGKGCVDCGHERRVTPMRMTRDGFIASAREVHGDRYCYAEVVWVDKDTRVQVRCPEHGDWSTYPETHLMGKGCPTCGAVRGGEANRKTLVQFVAEANVIHGGRYSYEQVVYETARKHVMVICHVHGGFPVTPSNHLTLRTGCPRCPAGSVSDASQEWLDGLGVPMAQREVRLPGLLVRVDGYDAAESIVYEYQGCFWHGCPECFDATDMNPRTSTTYGSLHTATAARTSRIREAGYVVVEMWEHDWKALSVRRGGMHLGEPTAC